MKPILRLTAVQLPGCLWAAGTYAVTTPPTPQFDVQGFILEECFLHHHYMRNGKC